MSNAKLKEGLGEIARGVSVLPGVTSAQASVVGEKVLTISAKIDKTNGLDPSGLPQQIATVNPVAGISRRRGAGPAGILGLLSAVPLVSELASEVGDWLSSIGIADQEQKLDEEQTNHSDELDNLRDQSCNCADSVKEIDETADRGMQEIIDVLLGFIGTLKNCPLVQLGSTILSSICEGLSSIESAVDDRNKSIGECYDGLQQLCEKASDNEPPAPKQYSPPAECPAPPPPHPSGGTGTTFAPPEPVPSTAATPEACPTTPAQAPQPDQQPRPAPAPAPAPAPVPAPAPLPEPQPAPDCPPASSAVLPPEPSPTKTVPQAAVSTGANAGLNINIAVEAKLDCPPSAVPGAAIAPTVPAQSPAPVIPAPPAVPPVGPAGECLVQRVVDGIEAFGQSVAECLSQIECPVEPIEDCPPPEPALEPECPQEAPEPEPEPVDQPECPEEAPAPEPKPEPVDQPECPEGTIAPPPELAEVKEPPPPPKKGLVAPMAVNGGEVAPAPEPAPAPAQAPAPAPETAAEDKPAGPDPEEEPVQQRARKTGGW